MPFVGSPPREYEETILEVRGDFDSALLEGSALEMIAAEVTHSSR